MKAIANIDVITISAGLLIEKGKEYDVEPIYREGYYGRGSNIYYPRKLEGFRCNSRFYLPDVFSLI
jgi:hypothetical protein